MSTPVFKILNQIHEISHVDKGHLLFIILQLFAFFECQENADVTTDDFKYTKDNRLTCKDKCLIVFNKPNINTAKFCCSHNFTSLVDLIKREIYNTPASGNSHTQVEGSPCV